MKIVINSVGANISKVDNLFRVIIGDIAQEYSANKIKQILISTSASITTDAIKLAVENDINIVFLDYSGHPFGRVSNTKPGSTTAIRRKQLKLVEIPLGTILVKEWIVQKLNQQSHHLKCLTAITSGDKRELLENTIRSIQSQILKICEIENRTIDSVRHTIEGHEGTAGRLYFSALGKVIPAPYRFKGRSKNPAQDTFNCMLNYGYGILYANVEASCFAAGLDPYIGIMHVDQYARATFAYDLVEMYRTHIDDVVFKLFLNGQVTETMFDKKDTGFWLNKNGKALLISAVHNKFAEKIRYKGRDIKIQNIFDYDSHTIAQRILEEV